MDIREKAKETLQWYSEIWENEVIEAMLEFAKEMCKLQKIECSENAEVVERIEDCIGYTLRIKEVDKNSILNCKNVCE